MAHRNPLSENRACSATMTYFMRSLPARVMCAVLSVFVLTFSGSLAHANQTRDMGIGLASVVDWSTQQPFLDVMKTARPWIGHRPGQWGGQNEADLLAAGVLDDKGWPTSIPSDLRGIGTVILTDLPAGATSLQGRYQLRYKGTGIVEVGGRATKVRYGKNRIEFDFTPGEGPVTITINRTDKRKTGDYIRDISVVHLDKIALYDAGEMFNPDWIRHIEQFKLLRFMDWMETNDSKQSKWADRPKPSDYTYARHGVPLEIMLELIQKTKADPWFNIPHLATDTYVREFAQMVKAQLDLDRTAYVEFSNEVWNWQFEQASWAEDQARARWNQDYAWMQYYGLRTAQVMEIWSDVFVQDRERLVTILSTQTGWQGLELDALNAPLWRAEDAQNPHPADRVDAYAIAGYFGRILGTPERAPLVREWIAASSERAGGDPIRKFDHAIALAAQDMRDGSISGDISDTIKDLADNIFPYHANVAHKNGLAFLMYEGGTHVTGIAEILDDDSLTEFFVALNYADEMGTLYSELLDIWQQSGGALFNAYADVTMPGMWGSWGHLRQQII